MSEHTIEMYDNKVWGHEVSEHGLERGYLDYLTLSKMVGDCIHNDYVREELFGEWEIVTGDFDEAVQQDYIISENGYRILRDYTDELVFYCERLNMYIWGVTHYGTAWNYVLTNVKLVDGDKL